MVRLTVDGVFQLFMLTVVIILILLGEADFALGIALGLAASGVPSFIERMLR